MHVHFTAPERYLRASHEIVRHPRLRATAKTLLLWALSLPPGSRDTILTIGNRMPEGRPAISGARVLTGPQRDAAMDSVIGWVNALDSDVQARRCTYRR